MNIMSVIFSKAKPLFVSNMCKNQAKSAPPEKFSQRNEWEITQKKIQWKFEKASTYLQENWFTEVCSKLSLKSDFLETVVFCDE